MAGLLGGVELSAGNVEQAVLQFYQSGATQVSTQNHQDPAPNIDMN